MPPHTLAELQRDMARLRFLREQIGEIEAARLARLEQHPEQANHTMISLLARVIWRRHRNCRHTRDPVAQSA